MDSIRRIVITLASSTQLSSLAQVDCLNKAMAGRPRYVIDGVSNLDIGSRIKMPAENQINQ